MRREPAGADGAELLTVRRGEVLVAAVLGDGTAQVPGTGQVLAWFGDVEERDGRVVVGADSVAVVGGSS
jgi:maltooligosyltrehalose trehalohydrolase